MLSRNEDGSQDLSKDNFHKHPRRVFDKIAHLETIVMAMGKHIDHLEQEKKEDH